MKRYLLASRGNHRSVQGSEIPRSLPIDQTLLELRGSRWVERQLRRIVRSTRVSLDATRGIVRILGPDTSHHVADPDLGETVAHFGGGIALSEVGAYRSPRRLFDLCFEDSWTGVFATRVLRELGEQEGVSILHLDDHTDMMPTLLVRGRDGLRDPALDEAFDPNDPDDWEASIFSGSIGIGSFVTALFHAARPVHVRHLNNRADSRNRLHEIGAADYTHPVLPDTKFAAICKANWQGPSLGSYLANSEPEVLLRSLPPGPLLVHVDLDYFINDFNGNLHGEDQRSIARKRQEAERKLDAFFRAFDDSQHEALRWIIATSPGFCSSVHWDWLLEQLEDRIDRLRMISQMRIAR